MPYVKEEVREYLRNITDAIDRRALTTPGMLEYLFAYIANDYLYLADLNHDSITDIRGALSGALAEFNRRVAFPYEDTKIIENGDVYDTSE